MALSKSDQEKLENIIIYCQKEIRSSWKKPTSGRASNAYFSIIKRINEEFRTRYSTLGEYWDQDEDAWPKEIGKKPILNSLK